MNEHDDKVNCCLSLVVQLGAIDSTTKPCRLRIVSTLAFLDLSLRKLFHIKAGFLRPMGKHTCKALDSGLDPSRQRLLGPSPDQRLLHPHSPWPIPRRLFYERHDLRLELHLASAQPINQAPVTHLGCAVEAGEIHHFTCALPADEIRQQAGVDDRGDPVLCLGHAEGRRRRRVPEVCAGGQLQPAAQTQPVDLRDR